MERCGAVQMEFVPNLDCVRKSRLPTERNLLKGDSHPNPNVVDEEIQRIGHRAHDGPFDDHYISALQRHVRFGAALYLGRE